jgi:cadmium resistance protein CadD (predicted permease)
MIHFLLSLLPVSLGIWAIFILFQKDQLLEKQGEWIKTKLGEKWSKPVVHCPVCMSSLWGLIGFFAIRYFFGVELPWRQLIPFIFCLCGLNTLLSKLTTKERVIVDE